MRLSPIWKVVLAAWFIVWGVLELGWVTFSNSGDVLAIGAIVVGVLLILDK